MGPMVIVCPPRGHFSPQKAGAIEIYIYDAVIHSRYRDDLVVIGRSTDRPYSNVSFIGVDTADDTVAYRRAVIDKIKELRPGYLEVHQHMHTCHGVAKAFKDVPTMVFRHSDIKSPKGPVKKLWRTRQYSIFDSIAFVSEFARSKFSADFPNLADRTYVAYNGIDTEVHKSDGVPKEKLIVFAGRMIPEKGVLEFVRSMKSILLDHPDWCAEVYGQVSSSHEGFNSELMTAIDDAGRQLTHKGRMPFDETMKAFARAEIVVVPSIWEETFGRTAMEANAYQAALVSSGRGGLREVSGDAAVFIEDITPEAIDRATRTLINDVDLRARLKSSGRQRAVKHLNIKKTVAVIDDHRAKILG